MGRGAITEGVEHPAEARGQLACWLEEAGYICAQVDASEALSAARRHPPDAALVGVSVPDEGGMWVTSFAIVKPSVSDEAKLTAMVKKAVA